MATSDGLVATSEELTPAAVPASEWLVATRALEEDALEEDAAAEELMTAGRAAAEGPRSRDASCSWRCPEQSKRKILHDCQSPHYDGTRTREAETTKKMESQTPA